MCYRCAICKCRIVQLECFLLLHFVGPCSMETLNICPMADSGGKGNFTEHCTLACWSIRIALCRHGLTLQLDCYLNICSSHPVFLHSSEVKACFMPLGKCVLLPCPWELCRMLCKACARSPSGAIWNLMTWRCITSQLSPVLLFLSFSLRGILFFKVIL